MTGRRALLAVAAFLAVPLVMLAVVRPTQSPLAVLVVLVVVALVLGVRPGASRWAAGGWVAGSVVWVTYASALAGNLVGSG